MITHLNVKGLALIESLEIEFSSGFNVITGETGAGKSILILALHFLTGAKVSTEVVRAGSDNATVQGSFLVPEEHPIHSLLLELGIESERAGEDLQINVRRQLSAKGRSQAWVNDIAISTSSLKEIGGMLVDVFAQHENQRLMNPDRHIYYLDLYGGHEKLLSEVRSLYDQCRDNIREMDELIKSATHLQADRDYIQYRLKELSDFAPSVQDYEGLSRLCEKADSTVTIKEAYSELLGLVDNGEQNIVSSLWQLSKSLQRLGSDGVEWQTRVTAIAQEIENLSFEWNKKAAEVDFDPAELDKAQSRHFAYQDLMRKHRLNDISELVNLQTKMEREIEIVENLSQVLREKLSVFEKSLEPLENTSEKLKKARLRASVDMKKSVQTEMQELSMKGARLDTEWTLVQSHLPEVDFQAVSLELAKEWARLSQRFGKISERGTEKAQFLLSSNPGEPSLPLVKIASGGELSRIMLGLKKTLAADAETCVLVFDEIDTGISGGVADIVGKKLRELSSQFQVICISHLPQVAVYADSHCLVKKDSHKNRTETSIVRLSSEESAKEVARLLSGSSVTSSSLAHAKNLISGARKKSKSSKGVVHKV